MVHSLPLNFKKKYQNRSEIYERDMNESVPVSHHSVESSVLLPPVNHQNLLQHDTGNDIELLQQFAATYNASNKPTQFHDSKDLTEFRDYLSGGENSQSKRRQSLMSNSRRPRNELNDLDLLAHSKEAYRHAMRNQNEPTFQESITI